MNRVLIVAPYASLRAGLEALLAEESDCRVVGAAAGSEELENLLPELRPDALLVDGEQTTEEFGNILTLAVAAEIPLVALGENGDELGRLLDGDAPAWAYLRREAEGGEIAAALRALASGLVVIDRALARRLQVAPPAAAAPTVAGTLSGRETLTGRERQVLEWMAQGLANKQIAGKLAISLHTVKFHVASILAKLGAGSRTEAVTIGARNGMVTL